MFDDVRFYSEGQFPRDESALFVVPLQDKAGAERLGELSRLDTTQAAELLVSAYDYRWAHEQIHEALRASAPEKLPIAPVSLVISRRPLTGRSQLSTIYVVPIEHHFLAEPVVARVIRALNTTTQELPGHGDPITRFADWVGAQLLVSEEILSAR